MSESGHWWERGEHLAAVREAERDGESGECYEHAWRPNSRGGGTCVRCGDTVDRDEL